ncbi:helix-turn-helix domain-containing protein [Aquimarina sp. SS2-1]|uniref:helix-turn-helix domain-containing protein n=1 Tax=Aquimarina besae TaxID=3342247 RepID=UPI00366AF3A7
MRLIPPRILFLLYILFFGVSYGQDKSSQEEFITEFEELTGKTSYQLLNYFIKKPDLDVVKKEMQLLSDKIMAGGSAATQAEWLYIKVRISFIRFKNDEYRRAYDNYNLFVQNNYGEGVYLAKQKLLEGYIHFYNGIWAKSLLSYEQALSLAIQENDMFTIVDSRKQIAYISTFSGDQVAGLKQLKNVFYDLDRGSETFADIKKDIPLLKIKILDLIYRFYWFNGISKVDSLAKYSSLYRDRIKEVNDSSEYSRMYTYVASTAVLNKQFDLAERYLDSAKMKDKGFSGISLIDYIQAELYYNQKKYKRGIELIEKFGDADSIPETLHSFSKLDFKFLAKSYKMLGDYERSNYYYEHYEKANTRFDKIMDSVSLGIRKREVAEFKKELEVLQAEKSSADSLLKYLVLGGLLVILFLLIMLIRFYKLKNKNEEQFLALVNSIEKEESVQISTNDSENESKSKKETNEINEETITNILQGLKKLEEQHYFLKQECSAYTTAKKIKTNTSYLSKVMNSHYQKTFNAYINDLRINYVLVRLKKDSRFRAYSIQGIAEELGYKSADSFTKYFKKHTGLLPSFYIKKLNALD